MWVSVSMYSLCACVSVFRISHPLYRNKCKFELPISIININWLRRSPSLSPEKSNKKSFDLFTVFCCYYCWIAINRISISDYSKKAVETQTHNLSTDQAKHTQYIPKVSEWKFGENEPKKKNAVTGYDENQMNFMENRSERIQWEKENKNQQRVKKARKVWIMEMANICNRSFRYVYSAYYVYVYWLNSLKFVGWNVCLCVCLCIFQTSAFQCLRAVFSRAALQDPIHVIVIVLSTSYTITYDFTTVLPTHSAPPTRPVPTHTQHVPCHAHNLYLNILHIPSIVVLRYLPY